MKNQLKESEYEQRWDEIPRPIQQAANNNPLLHKLCGMYAVSEIITMNELLCRMVIELNRNWGAQQEEYIKFLNMTTVSHNRNRHGSVIDGTTPSP